MMVARPILASVFCVLIGGGIGIALTGKLTDRA